MAKTMSLVIVSKENIEPYLKALPRDPASAWDSVNCICFNYKTFVSRSLAALLVLNTNLKFDMQ